MSPETTDPRQICMKCLKQCRADTDDDNRTWDEALLRYDLPIWRCPIEIKPNAVEPYPPLQCRYRVELIMLKDNGYKAPTICY